MPNFQVPTSSLFLLCLLLYFIGLSTADKSYAQCNELAKSPRLKEMTNNLKNLIPIEHIVWNEENGLVKYPELVDSIKNFMAEVKEKRLENSQSYWPFKKKDPIEIAAADDFLKHSIKIHEALVLILKKECRNKKPGIWHRSVTVQEVLEEAIECASRAKEVMEQELPVPNRKVWAEVDRKLKKVFPQIWVLAGPAELYKRCQQLSESSRFHTMLEKLTGDSQITLVKSDAGNTEDKQLYPNLIEALKNALSILEGAKHTNVEDKAQQALKKMLPIKCGIKEEANSGSSSASGPAGNASVTITVNEVLNETLDCADKVYQFIQKMQILKKRYDKELLYEGKWTALDWHFAGMLKSIFVQKANNGGVTIDAGDRRVYIPKH